MDKEDDKKQTEPQRGIQLTEAQLAKFQEHKTLTHRLASIREDQCELEITIFNLHKRRINESLESIRNFFRHDSKIEVFENKKAFAEKWETDCDIFLDKEFLYFLSFFDLPHTSYDYSSARWIAESNERVTTSFGISENGILAEIGRLEGNAAYEVNQLEISGFIALNQYVEFLRSNPASADQNQNEARCNLSSVIEEIYIPFYHDPNEFCFRFKDANGQPMESMPTLSWVSLSQVRNLIQLHLVKKNCWLYPLQNWARESGDIETEWFDSKKFATALERKLPDKIKEIRSEMAAFTTTKHFRLIEFAEDVSFEEC